MKTVDALYRDMRSRLPEEVHPALAARALLRKHLGWSEAQFWSRGDEPFPQEKTSALEQDIQQLQQGYPLAYLLGEKEFYGLLFEVNTHVLIPRPETEMIIDKLRALFHPQDALSYLDLGTGSGCLAITFAHLFPHAEVQAVDLSAQALEVARRNAQRQGVEVSFVLNHWLTDWQPSQRYHVITANPPYIDAARPEIKSGSLRFEPYTALVAGEQGKADLATIIEQAFDFLHPDGVVLLEHGFDQGEYTRQCLQERGYERIQTFIDLAGWPRMTLGHRPKRLTSAAD